LTGNHPSIRQRVSNWGAASRHNRRPLLRIEASTGFAFFTHSLYEYVNAVFVQLWIVARLRLRCRRGAARHGGNGRLTLVIGLDRLLDNRLTVRSRDFGGRIPIPEYRIPCRTEPPRLTKKAIDPIRVGSS
jgi:hypothetical protein